MNTVERAIIKFTYQAEVDPALTVKIVGDWVELGHWDPQKGCELTLSDDRVSYKCNLYLLMNTDIEYKYVFGTCDEWIWEELPSNRTAHIQDQRASIEDTADSLESIYTPADTPAPI